MNDLEEALGSSRLMALARELTKDYEEVRRGTISEIRESVVNNPSSR